MRPRGRCVGHAYQIFIEAGLCGRVLNRGKACVGLFHEDKDEMRKSSGPPFSPFLSKEGDSLILAVSSAKVQWGTTDMRIDNIIWLPEVVDKLGRKHRVSPEEVEEILCANPVYRKVQKGHVSGEDLYAALGQEESG